MSTLPLPCFVCAKRVSSKDHYYFIKEGGRGLYACADCGELALVSGQFSYCQKNTRHDKTVLVQNGVILEKPFTTWIGLGAARHERK